MLLTGLKGVLQTDGTVEHQMLRGGVTAVGTEVAQTDDSDRDNQQTFTRLPDSSVFAIRP